ncbi:uncharacterized protein LOC130666811 isoform X1 [Microplitis mediator]|uniref:uncharacterized protein LOC130666811 isoform X1 n=2 Tax=Microplitis mediator TaxID=375433 RepID=UPI0025575F60|nr:uncharacterized protein LOC130666811 isoform X1 [Microplitis mediator]
MGRCCVVNGCLSGRKVQEDKNILHLRKHRLFKVPKKPDLLEKWSTAIGQELKSTNCVCELHFKKTDIIKLDSTTLPDGNVFVSDRCRATIKPGAIPHLNVNQCYDSGCDNDNLSVINSMDIVDDEVNVDVLQENNSLLIQPVVNNLENVNAIKHADLFWQDYILTTSIVDDPILLNNVVDNENRSNINNNGMSSVHYPSDNSVSNSESVLLISGNCNVELKNNNDQQLSVHDIYNALEVKPLPRNWSWTFDHNQTIILSYLDSTCFKLKCHLKIKNDLTVTIVNACTDVCIDLSEEIPQIETVWEILNKAENYYFCSGTGYNENKVSSGCKGILSSDEYKKKMPLYRCIACRQARQNIQNRNNKQSKDFKGLYNSKKIELVLEKKKIRRLSEKTPDGIVKKSHWIALLKYEGHLNMNLRMAHNLSMHNVNPQGFAKMNVPLAIELFSKKVRAAMETLKNEPNCPELEDSDATIAFITKVGNLIKAMMSRTPMDALRPDDENLSKKAIVEFINYLRTWQSKATEEKEKQKLKVKNEKVKKRKSKTTNDFDDMNSDDFFFAITASTLSGLLISLQSTLELLDFLHDKCGYSYLMTARVTQDMLEKFFGIIRSACGSNDHPDPILFGQVLRLLCSYSLATPPKGSNVTAGELLESLIQTKESLAAAVAPKKDWLQKIDEIIENGCSDEICAAENETESSGYVDSVTDNDCSMNYDHLFIDDDDDDDDNNDDNDDDDDEETEKDAKKKEIEHEHLPDPRLQHDYDVAYSSEYVISYIAGYIARKMNRFSKCFDCVQCMQSNNPSERDKYIKIMSDGYLIYPSENLFVLIEHLERIVLTTVGTKTITIDTMYQIANDLSKSEIPALVGCDEHKKKLTRTIINNFLIMRGHFLAKSYNNRNCEKKMKTKRNRKNAKLL